MSSFLLALVFCHGVIILNSMVLHTVSRTLQKAGYTRPGSSRDFYQACLRYLPNFNFIEQTIKKILELHKRITHFYSEFSRT